MSSTYLNTLKQRLRELAEDCGCDQFHPPKNFDIAHSAEAAETVEHIKIRTIK